MASEARSGSGLWVSLAAVAALFFAFVPRPGSSPDEAKPVKPARPVPIKSLAADDAAGEGPLAPIRSFLGPDGVPPRAAAPPGWAPAQRFTVGLTGDRRLQVVQEQHRAERESGLYEWPDCCALQDCRLRFLVATVPDPADSGFAFLFDQLLEALQRALEQGNYVFDRAWLPWQSGASEKAPGAPAGERHPGMVLFRATQVIGQDRQPLPPDGKHHLLALLLVGETATTGIHKEAFANAVRLIRDCPPAVKEPGDSVQLRVLGPFFSGSALSLRIALDRSRTALLEKTPQPVEPLIQVVCGSASGFDPNEFVDAAWAGKGPKHDRIFQTTILPDRIVSHWLWKYLGDPANPMTTRAPRAITLLHEANTGFGQAALRAVRKGSAHHPQPLDGSADDPAFFAIPYPLHISQLRSSYTREQLARLASMGQPAAGRDLPFPSEESDRDAGRHEALQAQAPLLTAAVNDLVLDNVVMAVVQKRGKYVCLVSTDPQDKIFLARRIRDRNPDVQLATVGSSLLFTHEEYNSALRGMVVASTYPLYPAVQGWSVLGNNPVQTRVLFADESLEGSYNAALVHLADAHVDDNLTAQLLDYGWEGSCPNEATTLPPIWISVVGGNGQMIPVTHIPPQHYFKKQDPATGKDPLSFLVTRKKDAAGPGASDPSSSRFGRFTAPSLSFLAFLAILCPWLYFFRQAWMFVRISVWDASVKGLFARFKQRIDFAVVCLAQMLLFGELAVWSCLPVQVGPLPGNGLLYAGSLGVFLASILMVGAAWVVLLIAYWPALPVAGGDWLAPFRSLAGDWQPLWLLGRPWPRRRTAGNGIGARMRAFIENGPWAASGVWIGLAHYIMFLAVAAMPVLYLYRIVAAMNHPPGAEDAIRYERHGHFTNGVSALLPYMLLYTALFAWGFCLVKKLFLASQHAVATPFPTTPARFDILRRLDRNLRGELAPPSTLRIHFWQGAGLFALTGVGFVALLADMIPPLDGRLLGIVALAVFSMGAFLLLFTLLQFYAAWRVTRKMLYYLALLPMEAAFGRLNEKVVALFGHYLFSQRPRRSHLAVSVQQAEWLQQLYPAFQVAVAFNGKTTPLHPPLDAATLAKLGVAVQNAGGALARPPAAAAIKKNWSRKTSEDCRVLAEQCLTVLDCLWPAQSLAGAFGAPADTDKKTPFYLGLPEDDPIRQWAMAAEDFVAAEILRYLSQFTAQLRTLLTSLTIGSLLLVLAATVYPFFPQRQLLLGLTLLVGLVAAAIGAFLVQINRDELISRVTRSTPNRFTPDFTFFQGAATYVLPILAAMTFQFPFVTSTLRSLLDPLLHIVP